MSDRDISLATMRRIDARLGAPLCAGLTAVRRIRDLGHRADDAGPRRILIVKLAEQGATVAAATALHRATELVGRDNVHVAVFEQNRHVLDALDVIDRDHVLTVRTTSMPTMVADLLRLVRRCQELGIDAAVDFEFFSRLSAIVAYASGARLRTGLHSFSTEGPYRGDLFTHRLSANPLQHVSHTFRALVDALSLSPDVLPALDRGPWSLENAPRYQPSTGDLARVRAELRRALPDEDRRRLVILNPNTGDLVPLRRWPVDRYAQLANRVLDHAPDLAVVVTGAASEAEAAVALVDRVGSPRCVSLAGRTTLPELLALYHLAEVMVTNDSGPAHYATLTPLDTVALFGPETPTVFGPVGPRSRNLWAGLPCSPCVNAFNNRSSPCQDNLCMQRISVDQVVEEVTTALAARAERGAG